MLADCVPEVPSKKRVMEQLLPFLITSTQGLLCGLIENVSVQEPGPLPLLSEALYNLLKSRLIKFNRSQVLPKSINNESSGWGRRDPLNALFTRAVNYKTQIVSGLFNFIQLFGRRRHH